MRFEIQLVPGDLVSNRPLIVELNSIEPVGSRDIGDLFMESHTNLNRLRPAISPVLAWSRNAFVICFASTRVTS